MVRKTALVTAMLGAFASHAYALGLGEIKLNSALHQPLDAEIALLSATPEEVDQLKVRLASPEAYAQAGVERIYLHTRLRFNVVTRPDGSAVIQVTSQDPVREPYLDFMVQATWANGRLVREYTMLIDPPTLMPAEAPAPTPAAPTTRRRAAPTPEPAAPAPSRRQASFTGSEYGPVQRNDTLWTIAEKVRPDAGVSMQQTMLGLVRANPEAFQHGNVNNLKAGHVLRVPSREEFTSISPAEARAEVSRQHRLWREGRSEATRTMPASGEVERDAPAPETAEPEDSAAAAAANGDAQLKLVTPDEASGAAGTGEGGAGGEVAAVRQELSLAVEELEAQRQQNEDLNERLADLEQQIAQLHRLVQLSDDELARMQGELAGEEDAAVADGETMAEADTAGTPAPSAAQDMADESAPVEPVEPAPAEPEPADTAPTAPTAEAEPTPPAMQEELRTPAPAAPAEQGLLARFLANPLWQAGAGAVALLLLILAWLGARKRRMATTEFKESILAEPRGGDTASAAPAPAAPEAAAAATTAAAGAAAQAEPEDKPAPAASGGPQSDSSLFTDFSVSDMGAIQNEAEADPLAEADVYLAYGRYQQAEELIRGAIENEPGNTEYRLKLLEVFSAARNQSAFDAEAEAMLAQLENQDDPAWQRVKEMGRELNPSNALYQEGGAAPAAAPEAPVAAAPTPAEAGEDAGLADLEGLDLGETELPETAGEPETVAEAEPETEEDNSLDFDLGELESFSTEEAKPEATEEEKPAADLAGDDENLLEFDLSDSGEAAASAGETEEEVEVGEGELQAGDEVSTKLDLARAYIEMGDPEGARSILEEVMEEGNEAQKSEAETLLKDAG